MSGKDPELAALEALYAALKPLDTQARQRVLSSLFALMGMSSQQIGMTTTGQVVGLPSTQVRSSKSGTSPVLSRPKALTELMQEKRPGTNPQRIALFAYWREKYEAIPRFGREDLKAYFGKAKEPPPKNYDRDFNNAIKKGWLHEDGSESYITSKGLEAVENAFEGERSYSRGSKSSTKKVTKKTPRKKITKKKTTRNRK